jgi:hypothetical protein
VEWQAPMIKTAHAAIATRRRRQFPMKSHATRVRPQARDAVNALLVVSNLEGRDEVLTTGPNNRRSLGRGV